MDTLSRGQIIGGIAVVGALGVLLGMSGAFGFQDGGIDVSDTACEDIASARRAVDAEFLERKGAADEKLEADLEAVADAFYEENRRLEDAYHECSVKAYTSDPCKEAYEKIGKLYEEIMADFEADKGFNEAKFNEREEAKKEYNDCVANLHKPEYYEREAAKCEAKRKAGQEANTRTRTAAEARAQSAHDAAVKTAENAQAKKQAILDGIEKKCNEPGATTSVSVGGATSGSTGTKLQPNSSACTGVFEGNDPDLRRRLAQMEAKLAHAKAAGYHEGVYGIDHLQGAVDDLRAQLKESERTCKVDADCGDPTPVCCGPTTVGRLYCNAGVCASETTECTDPEICTGKPAQCLAPASGVQSAPVNISRTIPEKGTCSQNLQTLDLAQAGPESDRFEITGNIPSWLTFDKVGGKLPSKVNVSYSCATVQGFGPGTYTAQGSITVYNANNELINTIPVNVSITVTPVSASTGGTTGAVGTTPPITETETTPSDSEPIRVMPRNVEFTYNHAEPVCPLPVGTVEIDGPQGASWRITSTMPIWLRANKNNGDVPGSFNLEFPCQLDEYENQTQEKTLEITIVAPDGSTTKKTVDITGHFTNF